MTLSEFLCKRSILPGNITSHEFNKDFLREFKQLLSSSEAKKDDKVLYAFVCEKKIPRVKGESNIICIGKAEKGLEYRYWGSWTKRSWTDANRKFFNYVIKRYGPVSLVYLAQKDFIVSQPLKEAESDLLKDYYELHMELPPKNAQGYGAWSALPNKLRATNNQQ